MFSDWNTYPENNMRLIWALDRLEHYELSAREPAGRGQQAQGGEGCNVAKSELL